MSQLIPFEAKHMNITQDNVVGNGVKGRVILIPGSDGRAALMAERLLNRATKEHPRRHNFHYGHIVHKGKNIDVGIVSSGMGCPSIDIIATELFHLGARRFIRVGTTGSLQTHGNVHVGDLVVPTACVRDEGTSRHYLDPTIPAIASLEFLDGVRAAAKKLSLTNILHLGLAHTKDALYGRQLGEGPLAQENIHYMNHLRDVGVLVSEMECAQLYTLGQVWNALLQKKKEHSYTPVCVGAVLGVIGDGINFYDGPIADVAIGKAIDLAFATIVQLEA